MRSLPLVVLGFCYGIAQPQCLTDFTKLVPEPTLDIAQNFGHSVAMYDDYLAVGVPTSDSLGRLTGLVFIYQEQGSSWEKIATITPSDPANGLEFGIGVVLSEDYLLVSAAGGGGQVYVFRKGGTWSSETETAKLSAENSIQFGVGYYVRSTPVAISSDQNTIAIVDEAYRSNDFPPSSSGIVYVFHKSGSDEWSPTITPSTIDPPETDAQAFGTSGVAIHGNRIAIGTIYAPTANGEIYVFSDNSGTFASPSLEARLTIDINESYSLGFWNIVFTDDGIFTATGIHVNNPPVEFVIAWFKMPASGPWSDSQPTAYIDLHSEFGETVKNVELASNGTDLYAVMSDLAGNGKLLNIHDHTGLWMDADITLMDQYIYTDATLQKEYGLVCAANQESSVVIGFVPHPENANAIAALKVFSKESGSWESQLVYSSHTSSSQQYDGKRLLGLDSILFVSAPEDGTLHPGAGVVYIYHHMGGMWVKADRIIPPTSTPLGYEFGSALASNGQYLAVGATGYSPHGKVFVYKRTNDDWVSSELVQQIQLPEDTLTVFSFGDNLAMDGEWLLIPYVQNDPARIKLAFFHLVADQWILTQIQEIGVLNIFAKFTTWGVAIRGSTAVCGGEVFSLGEDGIWRLRARLSPSDPEAIQVTPDFMGVVHNGSNFGISTDMDDNTIFIGAPGKDDGATWDVGAVYVYTKPPNQDWKSATESIKLLPRVRDEGELFGYSLQALYNSLIVGAPGADRYKNGSSRNLPGRAYIFQANDYTWQSAYRLLDFTGDSFTKDYYGYCVGMDRNSFFIGMPFEDLPTGTLSGAVYITPTPPLVKLVPPVCLTDSTTMLFGYPFGGTWSGDGIISPDIGNVDLTALGPGLHEFTYQTVSCAYTGHLQLEIEDIPEVTFSSAFEKIVCPGSTINVSLSVPEITGYNYRWYLRTDSISPFLAILDATTSSLNATQRGIYQVQVSNKACNLYSPEYSISDEKPIVIDEGDLGTFCNNESNIALNDGGLDGVWSGTGVRSGAFNPEELAAGSTH